MHKNFLTKRKQYMPQCSAITEHSFRAYIELCGVPQSSVLQQYLFILNTSNKSTQTNPSKIYTGKIHEIEAKHIQTKDASK